MLYQILLSFSQEQLCYLLMEDIFDTIFFVSVFLLNKNTSLDAYPPDGLTNKSVFSSFLFHLFYHLYFYFYLLVIYIYMVL